VNRAFFAKILNSCCIFWRSVEPQINRSIVPVVFVSIQCCAEAWEDRAMTKIHTLMASKEEESRLALDSSRQVAALVTLRKVQPMDSRTLSLQVGDGSGVTAVGGEQSGAEVVEIAGRTTGLQ
jgi:ABC-type hemin transport system substrate-binding protein